MKLLPIIIMTGIAPFVPFLLIVFINGKIGTTRENDPRITASMDWCEINFEVTDLIVEFFNSLSSLAYIIASLYGAIWFIISGFPPRYAIAQFALTLVGLGSFIYHATLQRTTQLCDECPMLICSLSVFYGTINNFDKPLLSWQKLGLIIGLVIYGVTAFSIYLIWDFYASFTFGYILIIASIIFRCFHIMSEQDKSKEKQENKICHLAVICQCIGMGCWLMDIIVCDYLRDFRSLIGYPFAPLFELHAWWHIFTALASYHAIWFGAANWVRWTNACLSCSNDNESLNYKYDKPKIMKKNKPIYKLKSLCHHPNSHGSFNILYTLFGTYPYSIKLYYWNMKTGKSCVGMNSELYKTNCDISVSKNKKI